MCWIYAPLVNQEHLIGSNKKQFYENFKNIDRLLINSTDRLLYSDLILINQSIVDSDKIKMWIEDGIRIIDLVNIKDIDRNTERYEGIYW